ncbi:glutamate receptor-like [Panulirus ornatus]|uniref:glutamate receptor-like n=1 Tax=Panulirus ornatus TaxID=150431 RepID=UPI003A8B9F57
MMGMVHREEVEFALGPFTVTPQRETISDFSEPLHNDNVALVTVRPGLESDVAGFLKPFTTKVWLLVLLSLLSISIAMVCIVLAEGKVFHTPTKNIASKVFTWVLQTVTLESSEWLPQRDGGRLIVTTWLLASLVFMTSYSGILTAMLTLPRVTIPIDSLADLVAQSDLPWRLEAGAMTPKYLMESGEPVRQKVVTGMSGTFPDCWAAREAIASGEYAAVCDETTIKMAMSWDFSTHGKCHMYIAKQRVYTNAIMAMAFKRNSSYLPSVNKIIRSVRQAGVVAKWLESQVTNTSYCLRPPGASRRDGVSPLNLQSFFGTLLVLLGGMLTSLGKFAEMF